MNIAEYEIKPCPFCGRKPIYRVRDKYYGPERVDVKIEWQIGCSNHNCFASILTTSWHYYSYQKDLKENVFDNVPPWMIEAWNKRS